jgi:hypothetical protein
MFPWAPIAPDIAIMIWKVCRPLLRLPGFPHPHPADMEPARPRSIVL